MPNMENEPRPPSEEGSSGRSDNLSKRFMRQEGSGKDPDLKPWNPKIDRAPRTGARNHLLASRRRISFLGWGIAALVSLGLWALLVYGFIRFF